MSDSYVIRPGLLVSLKSSVTGGITYQRVDLDAAEIACPDCTNGPDDAPTERAACKTCGGKGLVSSSDGREVTRWETKRVIDDKAEHAAAVKCRSAALAAVRKVCGATSFGLLCPADQEGALDAAIAAARALVDAHNASARSTRVSVFALKGRVASDDAEAARAITSEVAALMGQMDAGIKAFDPEAIRAAANRAREIGAMLSDERREKIDAAIEQARRAARTIVRRVQKEGEDRAAVLQDIQRGQIDSARIAFLDLSEPALASDPLPAVERQRFADLDLDDRAVGAIALGPREQLSLLPAVDLPAT